MRTILAVLAVVLGAPAASLNLEAEFTNIDGGTHRLSDWAGQPVLVVNTASLCGFTHQYDALQALHTRYAKAGLIVLAVPSDDFNQELDDEGAIKEFCEINYDLTLPMTGMTNVKGPDAHPFYQSLEAEGFTPNWNFNKVLIGPDGALVATYRSRISPTSRKITREVERLLSAPDS
ncbi:MAG: glutathione peroxidase [Pseudomonadota bacterium]